MNIANEEELLKILSEDTENSSDPEIEALVSSINALTKNIQVIMGVEQPALAEIASQLDDRIRNLRTQRRKVEDYFAGSGPLGRKIKQFIALSKYSDPCDENKVVKELESLLESFRFPLIVDVVYRKRFESFLEKCIFPYVYAEIRPVPKDSVKAVGVSTPSGFYYLDDNQATTHNILVLNAEIPNDRLKNQPSARVCFIAISNTPAQLFYYHPKDDRWMTADFHTFVFPTLSVLKEEYLRVTRAFHEHHVPMDVENEFFQLEDRAREIFERESYLPQRFSNYMRSGDSSEILVQELDYSFVFRYSRGVYSSRSSSIMQNFGGINQSIRLEQIPFDVVYRLISQAKQGFETMRTYIDGEVQKQNQTLYSK